MKVYDTLIIGSGYASIGYATANKNTLVVEEHQICDTGFYLPMRSFKYKKHTPKTQEGVLLNQVFNDLALFNDNGQNLNGFECALCKYLTINPINILLKCRVIKNENFGDGLNKVTLYTNEGLTEVLAKKVISSLPQIAKRRMTVLFISKNLDIDKTQILNAFSDAVIEPAFYNDRYALHFTVLDKDENTAKLTVYKKWNLLNVCAKILYISPVFYGEDVSNNALSDFNYDNPIHAFEVGYLKGEDER